MNASNDAGALFVEARYTEQRIPRYRGNPLIEALPPLLDDEALAQELTQFPEFEPAQRDWQTHERLLLVAGLGNFMLPMPRHIQLARSLETMMLEGYVGRLPRTAAHVRTLQMLYDRQKAGAAFSTTPHSQRTALSSALIGMSSWRTLLMDDPVQHIDDFRALHLVEVLAALRLGGRQIVCAVEDEALADLLCRRLLSTSESVGRRYELDIGPTGATTVVLEREVPPMPTGVLRSRSAIQAIS